MQQEISDDVKIGSSVTPVQRVGKSPAVDKTASDFENANLKVKKIRRLIEQGIFDADIVRYIPRMLDLVFQRMIEKLMTIEQLADTTYSNREVLDFELILDNSYYTNLEDLHIYFAIRFRKLTNAAQNLDAGIYPVHIFFALWMKEIDITKYGTIKSLIRTTTPKEVYRYSDAMLLHLPKNALKMIEKALLYDKKPVIIPGNEDRRSHTNNDVNMTADDNLENRKDKFADQIDSKYVYRITLKYLCDLGKISVLTKIDLKIRCMLQTNMKQLFESKNK